MDDKPASRVDFLEDPMPDECFLRWPGKPSVDYDPNYVANGREAVQKFANYVLTCRQITGESLISACADMHRVFGAGISGTNFYKRLDLARSDGGSDGGILTDWPTGEFRPEMDVRSSRPEADLYANYVNRVVLKNAAPLKTGPIQIEGIPESAWPANQGYYNDAEQRNARFHIYPSVSFLQLYFDKAAPLLAKARLRYEDPGKALAAIADYYYVMVNARPYAVLNNGLFMSQVNVLLRLHGLSPVCHGELDRLARRFQLKDFHFLFQKHIVEGLPREPELATCQFIISHPSKPKFMAIRHKGGHLPPTVKIPYGFDAARNVNYVLDGVRRKYGLSTFALRHLVWLPEFQCIELEILGKDERPLSAVWVGLDDYRNIRQTDGETHDPFADWLLARSHETIPPQRPPWERAGWFREASQWIKHQLGRLNTHSTGAIVQYGAFRSEALVLQVPTSRGDLFFKASAATQPHEVALMRLLADHWPGYVTELIAYDQDRNWMLIPNYETNREDSGTWEDFASAAGILGKIQAESVAVAHELRDLGCEILGPGQLRSFLLEYERLETFHKLMTARLTDTEQQKLASLAPRLADLCSRMSEFNIPETLVHPDFCAANLFIHSGSVRIIDWANSSLGHPFFSLMKLLRINHRGALEDPRHDPVIQSYLQAFSTAETESRLLEALSLAHQLQHAWRLLHWSRQVSRFEPRSTAMARLSRHVPQIAREMLLAHHQGR